MLPQHQVIKLMMSRTQLKLEKKKIKDANAQTLHSYPLVKGYTF